MEAVAANMEARGIKGYALDAEGFFRSNYCYPPKIMEISGNHLPLAGDTLLRVWAEKSTMSLIWPDASGTLSTIYQHVRDADMFHRGLPIRGQCPLPDVIRDDSSSKIWAIYENYGAQDAAHLAAYTNGAGGVKVLFSTTQAFQAVGRDAVGTSTHTLIAVPGPNPSAANHLFSWQMPPPVRSEPPRPVAPMWPQGLPIGATGSLPAQ